MRTKILYDHGAASKETEGISVVFMSRSNAVMAFSFFHRPKLNFYSVEIEHFGSFIEDILRNALF